MSMDEDDDDYKGAIEAGQRNLRATKLLNNWCLHAELARTPGRGLLEAGTGLPIGHMGVQCKFSKKNSMLCWLLEDAAYDFYQNNCKGCKERVPVGLPNILEFVGPREQAAEKRKNEHEQAEQLRKQKQVNRQQQRAQLRYELSLEETFVLDLLDELDREDIATSDPRLEHLANLAPETFTRKIVQHLLPAVLHEHLPYSTPAAKALLRAPLEPHEKLSVAVRLVSNYENSSTAIDVVLSGAKELSLDDLRSVLRRFVSMALGPPPGIHFPTSEPIVLDAAPVSSLFHERHAEICGEVDALISDSNPENIQNAIEIVLAVDDDELLAKHIRTIFAKLMRRRTLLPRERRDSNVLYYLRRAASRCLERFPDDTDKAIQSFLADNDDTGREEAYSTYASALNRNHRESTIQIGTAQRISFQRLLWAAIEDPEIRDEAGQYFRHGIYEYAELAVEFFDDLIGAAATLSEKYEQANKGSSIELPSDMLSQMEKSNKLSAIDSLQEALIKWAAVGAKVKGSEGIKDFLELYRRMPIEDTQMRGKMIAHVSQLLSGVESLTLVLSDWYRALMDESTVVRSSAVRAWEDVPYALVNNFPDLFFEAFSILLTDPYIIVHRSAVRALRRRSFPEEKRSLIKPGLWNLIFYYSQQNKKEEFLVDCIEAYAYLCISPEERKGKTGTILTRILLSLDGHPLYHAVDRLHHGFNDVPGFVKVALKSIQDSYTRSISIDDCTSAILEAPPNELQGSVGEIKNAFEALKPFRREGFTEALLYAAALTKAGDYAGASNCFGQMLENIPVETRNEQWRREISLVATASVIEQAIGSGEAFVELAETWGGLRADLEKENEERAKRRDFPPHFFD